MQVSLGFSPCPNDTFIFDALVNNKIDTQGFEFTIHLEDVQTLNDMAINHQLDFSKISYGVLPLVINNYVVLNSGSALGNGVGPLLISNQLLNHDEIDKCIIAIPGANTTAHMLFSSAFPNAENKVFLRYDQIESFVLEKTPEKRAGVIIHENRFTYYERGLIKIMDLGEYWEDKTGTPIPLGGIVGKRTIEKNILKQVETLIVESIHFSLSQYPWLSDYIKKHSQEMSEEVMRKHIELYVNDYSINLGVTGKEAIKRMMLTREINLNDDQVFL